MPRELIKFFDLVHDPPDRLKCIIGKHVLRNAMQTSCGCRFCEKCINKYLKEGEKPCPSNHPDCAETKLMLNRDIHQDNAANKEIENLTAKCSFGSYMMKDSLKMILIHVEECEYREMTCGECGSEYSWKDKDKHAKEECNQRIEKCPHWHKEMTALRQQTKHLNEDHEDLCSKYVSDCKNGCGAKNVNLEDHLKNCPNKKVDCPFEPLQCKFERLSKANLETNCDIFIKFLILRLMKKISKCSNKRKIKYFINLFINFINKFSGVNPAIPERNARFTWKFIYVDAKTGMNASVKSDPFYTKDGGYKMCLIIYPYGYGVGRSTHLSVFFVIMKGKHDDVLSWPFKENETLTLLDQKNNCDKHHSDTFKPDARSACYQKPIDDCNIQWGSSKFIPLTALLNHSRFCKNDTIFLDVTL